MKLVFDRQARTRAKALFARAIERGGGGHLPIAPLTAHRREVLRVAHWFLAVAAGAFVAAFALLGLGFTGALDLDRFGPSIEAALSSKLFSGDAVEIRQLRLKRDGWAAAISFSGLTVRDSTGRAVLKAPEGAVGLDIVSLFTGNVVVRRLELDRLDVHVEVQPQGLAIAIASDAASDAAPPSDTAGGGDLNAALDMLANLDRVAIRDARVSVHAQSAAKPVVFEAFDTTFSHRGSEFESTGSARGPSGPFSWRAEATVGDAITTTFALNDLAIADFLALAPSPPPLTFDAPFNASGTATFSGWAMPSALRMRFGFGAGRLASVGPDAMVSVIDEAGGLVELDGSSGKFIVKDLQFLSGETAVALSGALKPPEAGRTAWGLNLTTDKAVLGPGKPGENALPFKAALDADADLATGFLRVQRLSFSTDRTRGDMTLESRPDGAGRTLKMALNIEKGSATDVIRLWPRLINPPARDWCRNNVLAGDNVSGSITTDLDAANLDALTHQRAVEADRVHGQGRGTNLLIQLFPPGETAPPMTIPDGSFEFTGHVFRARAESARFDLGAGRSLGLRDVDYFIPDTTPAYRTPSHATAQVASSADALIDFLGREPMRGFLGGTMDPSSVRGQFDGQIRVDVPLGQNVALTEMKVQGQGMFSNFTLERAIGTQKIENATLAMTLGSEGLKIGGQGDFLGVPTSIDVAKLGRDAGSATLAFTLDNSARKRLGVTIPGLDGFVGVKVKAPWTRASADVELDLAKLAVDSAVFGSIKPAGKPGRATLTLKQNERGYFAPALTLDAGALQAKGAAQFDETGSPTSFRMGSLRLFGSDEMRLEAAWDQAVWRVSVKGGQFDARPALQTYFKRGAATGKSASDFDLDLDGQFTSLIGGKNVPFNQVQFSLSRRNGAFQAISAQGKLGEGPATYARDEKGVGSVHVADTGALLRFLDFYSHMEGGALDVAFRDDGDNEDGKLQLRDFTVRNEPALRQLAAAGKPTKSGTDAVPFDPDTVTFEKLQATFRRTSTRMDIADAVIFNPVIGMTTQGTVDFARNTVDLSGDFIPAYHFNSFVGKIPLVGLLLSGGKDEGVFAVNYRLSGALDKSTLTVDPLSAVAPGIFRKVMSAIDGTASAAAATPPSQ